MATLTEIEQHFMAQAEACIKLGSPFTGRLCRILPTLLSEQTATGRKVVNWPGNPRSDALSLRLCGGLHHLVLTGQNKHLASVYPPMDVNDATLATALRAAIARHDPWLAAFLDSPPQTNEVARSAMLLPGFLVIARQTTWPLALHEIGASAGLNQLFDRFGYRYGDVRWGSAVSPVQLCPDVRGQPPLEGQLRIASRNSSDIAPVDLSDPAARLRLQAYIWPDQPQRLLRLRGALEIASADLSKVRRAGAADFVRDSLAARQRDTTFVLFHSIMWQYMPPSTQDQIAQMMSEAGSTASTASPIAWLRMEPDDTRQPHAMLTLTLWPDGETRKLARCDYHGRGIDWIGS